MRKGAGPEYESTIIGIWLFPVCVVTCDRAAHTVELAFSIERRLSVNNLTLENNFADVSTECSSRHQGESERIAKQRCYL